MRMVAESRTVEDREGRDMVREDHDSAVLVGRRWVFSGTLPGTSEPHCICEGQDAKHAACDKHGHGWLARTLETPRPFMIGVGYAACLSAGCDLKEGMAAPSVGSGSRTTLGELHPAHQEPA